MEKFRELRILHGTSTHFRENVKDWFQIEHELCDWIINLWYYSKYMNDDEILEMYAFVNLELIKDYWDKENYIDCEFLIGHLLANDPSFFNFEVFIQAKNYSFSKYNIYNIITKPDRVPSSFQKKNELFNEDSTSFNCFKLLSVSSFFSFKKKKKKKKWLVQFILLAHSRKTCPTTQYMNWFGLFGIATAGENGGVIHH